jgi:putative nucleotidyltransferase with HDIG domain
MKNDTKGPSSKKKGSKDSIQQRVKYVDQSLRFLDWVNQLGIERTWFGRLLQTMDEKFQLRRLALLFLFSVVIAFAMNFEFDFSFRPYQVGDIAMTDIKSPISFEMIDEHATAQQKVAAEDTVPLVFDLRKDTTDIVVGRVYEAFRAMRKVMPATFSKNEHRREEQIKGLLIHRPEFETILGDAKISNPTFEWLVANRFSVRIENAVIRQLDRLSGVKLVNDLFPIEEGGQGQIIVRVIERSGISEEHTESIENLTDLAGIRKLIKLDPARFKGDEIKPLTDFISRIIVPNLTINQQETSDRRQRARESILPVMVSAKKNQIILNEGGVVQDSHLRMINQIYQRQASHRKDMLSLVVAIFFVSIILVFSSYIRRFTLNRVSVNPKDMVVMALVTLMIIIVSKFVYFVAIEAIDRKLGLLIPESAYMYLLPIAAGPMIVGLLITSGEVVWLFTTFLAAAVSIMLGYSFEVLIFGIAGGIAGARGVHACKKRQDIYVAGIRVGLVNALVVGLLTLGAYMREGGPEISVVGFGMLAGLISGILSSFVTMMLVPLFESVFNYTTDVRLLELSNLNHPLLKEMIVKSPGTYHHSLVVGNMVEAASEAIGANSLLAKVSSYYHDIGKMEHSQYFIENQKAGNNPHDYLSPHMSKTILIAHVKDGVELGIKYKLGKPLIDVILQHHGTTLISFFYNRAKEEEDADIDQIEESEFRYPGPKPQFKEAALCMLADSIEAAARSLDEPNPMRLRNIVKNIIHRKFMDGQLEECDLTLKDLSEIENSFYQILIGIYHQRIDYPRNAGGGASEGPVKDGQKVPLKSV